MYLSLISFGISDKKMEYKQDIFIEKAEDNSLVHSVQVLLKYKI